MEIIVAIVVFGLVFAGLAIGLLLANKPLQGSCGGLNQLDGQDSCQLCGKTAEEKAECRRTRQA